MKKKIISFIGLALFVGVVLFNLHMTNQTDDVTLKNIEAVTASASGSGGGGWPNCCDEIWTVTYSGGTDTYVECTTGGNYKCPLCCLEFL
jgi:hypothetical protein